MTLNHNNMHLIERAAARLRQPTPELVPISSNEETSELPDGQALAGRDAGENQGDFSGQVKPIDAAALARAGMIDTGQRYNRVAEEFRIIQTKLLRQSFGAANGTTIAEPRNLVMITSALRAEGKSFTSLNLAADVARQGERRVLLVDADPKPGGLGELLGLSATLGFLDLVRDHRLEVADLIIPTVAEKLDVLPLGKIGERSLDLFSSKRMGQFLQELGRQYADRLIILDAPPCLSSSTPHALAEVVGQVVFVVGANSTQQGDVEAALGLIQNCPHVSLLLNKIAPWAEHSFGSYTYASAQA